MKKKGDDKKMELLEGKFISNEHGFGFVKVEGEDSDIFISPRDTKGAMNDDIVTVKILNKKHGQNREGQVIKILKRGTKRIVGTFQKSKNFGFVVPDNTKIKNDIFISKSKWGKAKNIPTQSGISLCFAAPSCTFLPFCSAAFYFSCPAKYLPRNYPR